MLSYRSEPHRLDSASVATECSQPDSEAYIGIVTRDDVARTQGGACDRRERNKRENRFKKRKS